MKRKSREAPNIQKTVVTALGAFGYISLLLQWLWLVGLYLPMLMRSELRALFIPEPDKTEITHTIAIGGPDILWLIIGIGVTAIVLVVTVIALARLPMAIAKTGNKASEAVAEAALPIITHRQPLPPKKRRRLTARLIGYAKICFALLPLLGLIGLLFTAFDLSSDIVIFLSVFLALGTTIWFTLQYVVAKLLHVPLEKII